MQTAIFPRVKGKHKRIPFGDILYIEANRNYSDIITVQGEKITVCNTLAAVEAKLPQRHFYRAHRSYIVSLQNITDFDHNVITVGGHEIPTTRTHFQQLKKQLITFCAEGEKPEAELNYSF